jgi:pimeloyl-ACP methyl ester carboxylesterase
MRFLLIPGAGGAAWYWHRVVPLLEAAGHAAIAVDLPADDESAGLPEYVATGVAAARRPQQRGELIVVGASLGAFSAPLIADRVKASLIVLVNGMIAAPNETAGQWWATTGHAQAMAEHDGTPIASPNEAPGGPKFDEAWYFLHDVPESVLASAPPVRPQSGSAFVAPFAPAWPDIPTRVIAGRDDRFFPLDFQRRIARSRLGLEVEVVPGGHLVALSHPVELAERLLADAADVLGHPKVGDRRAIGPER